ncbi:MAG: excinuclease ATPase subunit [Oscillospiraceae bacterium]|nr:excinuclease ATPase subunit [Oscillospiraceae bacterium]
MSWGPCFMYYHCPECGKKFKSATDMIQDLGPKFGMCPVCGAEGVLDKEGARTPDDADYEEVD